ncbi:MarR family winged helix-turn-helix transcriptional regulator [Kutzneria kofuensis]|uniref:DNA-binding MarR family transcriptional regulator n=1 Tax=Kutzneria kofuensis TaxID=103725 RepID=A0A7W9NL63_9PSEU|nr:MarR family winged helix-turn-helix transcriptional regulator [Kutzneria kofuensis]MBB5896121.1 DNA-binding MarR family transcriptional regulator [Kutzneria kofuensis]
MATPTPEPEPLIRLLWRAHNWFRAAVIAALDAGDDPATITAAQATLLSQLPSDGASIAELARLIGVSSPTVHQWVHELVAMDALTVEPDPASARTKLVRLTESGHRRRARTMRLLAGIEANLAEVIGAGTVDALRAALEAPWGDPEAAAGSRS